MPETINGGDLSQMNTGRDIDAIKTALRNSSFPGKSELLRDASVGHISVAGEVDAANLRDIYTVRLAGYASTGLPPSKWFKEFVDSLPASGSVVLFSVETSRHLWVGSVQDGNKILGAIMIERR